MMHQLTISIDHCRGPHLCHACDAIQPGMVQHCEQHGRLLISGPSTTEHSATISRLIASCPDRAITIKPVDP